MADIAGFEHGRGHKLRDVGSLQKLEKAACSLSVGKRESPADTFECRSGRPLLDLTYRNVQLF